MGQKSHTLVRYFYARTQTITKKSMGNDEITYSGLGRLALTLEGLKVPPILSAAALNLPHLLANAQQTTAIRGPWQLELQDNFISMLNVEKSNTLTNRLAGNSFNYMFL